MSKYHSQQGMTLIEILVTLTIVAIITTFAIPGMNRLMNSQATLSQTSKLNAALAYARSEAVTRVGSIGMCASSDGAACSGGLSWSNGWIIYTENNEIDGLQSGDEILKVQQSLPLSTRLGADTGLINFNNLGRPASTITFDLCDKDASVDLSRVIKLYRTGSTRTTTGGATCPAS